jgi:hypothetical protein
LLQKPGKSAMILKTAISSAQYTGSVQLGYKELVTLGTKTALCACCGENAQLGISFLIKSYFAFKFWISPNFCIDY